MKKLGIGLAVLLVVAGGVFAYLNSSSNGIVGFYAWKALTGEGAGARADVNGVSIYYETFGEGEPVLVLHGGSAFLETMHYQIRALADDHLVIAPDSRAHGRSSDEEGAPLSYAQMADDMIALMDHLGLDRADVYGWSDGGNIGLDMALRYPERVNRIVMYGSNFHYDGLAPGDPEDTSRSDPEHATWETVRSFYKSIAPDPDHWPVFHGKLMTMWETQPMHTVTDLARIKAPVLVMAGEFDSIQESHTRAMAEAIPGGRVLIVPGEDHYAPIMAPDSVTPHVVAFLD